MVADDSCASKSDFKVPFFINFHIDDFQGGKDPAADFVVCTGEQLCQKGEFANQNTGRH